MAWLSVQQQRVRAWSDARFFSGAQVCFVLAAFFGTLFLLNRALYFFHTRIYYFDFVPNWPMTADWRLPPAYGYLLALLAAAAFVPPARRISRDGGSLPLILLSGIALIALTNLFHGAHVGYFNPIATTPDGVEYWHDAIKIRDAGAFLRDFNEIQPSLLNHARTHPPAAVLVFYGMHALGLPPSAMAIVLAVVSSTVAAWSFARLAMRLDIDAATARYGAFLLLLVPSTQVYYLASIDALIAALFTAAVLCFVSRSRAISVLGTAALVSLAGSLTFAFVFLLPVIWAYEFLCLRTVVRSASATAIAAACLVGCHALVGVDYLAAFRTASALENPEGPYIFIRPLSYVMTRAENVGDILTFLGPLATVLCVRGLASPDVKTRELRILAGAGIVALLAMFVTGALRTGETSRACAFIYPYLLLPVAAHVQTHALPARDRFVLAAVTFGQAIVMQLFGHYLW